MYGTSQQSIDLLSCICYEGDEVVIVKSDLRICGCGAALATGPIVQNKAYFEVKVQCGGKSCHAPVYR